MIKLSKRIASGIVFISIAAASPFILATLNMWPESFASTPTFQVNNKPDLPLMSYADAVELAMPAVVSIYTTKEISIEMHPLFQDPFFRHFFGDPSQGGGAVREQQPGLGSGVIVNKDGVILTNNHVIRDATEIKVKLNSGEEVDATLLGSDAESDLAVLKIDKKDLPVILIGESKTLRIGDPVLAIGNPFGVGQTVTQGIVSAKQRSGLGINTFENFIQTDASINPGNSGGALIDGYGRLVGINTAIFSRSGGNLGIGFAIPVELAKEVMSQLIDHGHVTRGWLGISIRPLTDDLRKSLLYPKGEGCVIAGIVREGPAHKSGLVPGDIVLSINGVATTDPAALQTLTADLKPDTTYPLVIFRQGQTLDYQVTIGKRPVQETKKAEPSTPKKP